MKSKLFKIELFLALSSAFFSISPLISATDAITERTEDSTESPVADMAMVEPEMKTATEKPPTLESINKDEKPTSQRQTVADFIIHPLIAFKPRNPEDDVVLSTGKQATSASSSTTPSPWQLFGFNAGQGLGSLAGSVTGWLNDRIQLPSLVETPVRESTTQSTTSTTSTTPAPDVVVRVQHSPSTRRPLITINNRKRPYRPNFDSNENNDDDEEEIEDVEYSNEDGEADADTEEEADAEVSEEREDSENSEEENDNEIDVDGENEEETEEDDDDDEDENISHQPNNIRKPIRRRNYLHRGNANNFKQRAVPVRHRPMNINEETEEDVSNDDEESDEKRPSTKRSQSQTSSNLIRRGQQQLINQIRQLTGGQIPAEIASMIRRPQMKNSGKRRRQQATLYVNQNGQTIYLSPNLAQLGQPAYAQNIVYKAPGGFPQPPLTVPLRQKGQPVQYITIPWNQLGISPPNNIVSLTEGLQSQPLILNIPQSAVNVMQNQARPGQSNRKKKRPQLITSEAVPLLAEASLMDIFKPPQIPPSRTSTSAKPVRKPVKPTSSKATPLVQKRIRPATIVEMAPGMSNDEKKTDSSEIPSSDNPKVSIDIHQVTGENEYILVGNDDEPGITRQVAPVYGDARFVHIKGNSVPAQRFIVHRGGRELTLSDAKNEQEIPVQIISESEQWPIPNDQQLDSKLSESKPVPNGDMNAPVQHMTLPLVLNENIEKVKEIMST